MLERASIRTLPLVSRAAEHAPVATACCNACRTCVSSNLLALATGGAVALAAAVRRLARRATGT
jgi:hypothetical protein